MKYILLLISIILIISCNICNEDNDPLFNVWIKYDDNFSNPNTFQSATELDDNRYGFIIEPDGQFIVRKNGGWCGTPPISYKIFDGVWKYISDDTLEVIAEFWGGQDTFKIEILSVNDSELIMNYIYNYE